MKVMLSASTAISYTTVYVTQAIEIPMSRDETLEGVVDRVKMAIMRSNEPYKVRFEMVTSMITENGKNARVLISYYLVRI